MCRETYPRLDPHSRSAEKYDFSEIFERINCYGNVKKIALINEECGDLSYQYETTDFYTKQQIEQKYLEAIKDKEKELKALQERYENFIQI